MPPLPQDVIAALIAGVSSKEVSPRLAGVHVARFAWATRSGTSPSAGAAKVEVAPREIRSRLSERGNMMSGGSKEFGTGIGREFGVRMRD